MVPKGREEERNGVNKEQENGRVKKILRLGWEDVKLQKRNGQVLGGRGELCGSIKLSMTEKGVCVWLGDGVLGRGSLQTMGGKTN